MLVEGSFPGAQKARNDRAFSTDFFKDQCVGAAMALVLTITD